MLFNSQLLIHQINQSITEKYRLSYAFFINLID